MFFKGDEMTVEPRVRLRDGFGTTDFVQLVPKEHLPAKSRLFSLMCLEKGCSVGRHDHTNETEIYYVVEGEGIINDNGTIRPFRKGDCSVCGGGSFHSVSNENDETLKIVAVIILD
jgi:mannose-6-phosphate isomerase-like protein (cupin superfamily)